MGYTDFNFQLDYDDRKSLSGYVFTLNGGAVYWKNSKQHTAVDSICEAEYNAASDAATYSALLSSGARDRELKWHRTSEDRQKGEYVGKYVPKVNRQPVDGWATLYCNWFVNK